MTNTEAYNIDIALLREVIDRDDRVIIARIQNRARTVKRIQRIKVRYGQPEIDWQRETDIIETYRNAFPLDGDTLAQEIMRVGRRVTV